ncbi:MAG: hypothetical protein L3J26_12135 [Candidatus Polarisedimenticolaceae bacterium]|nr:hypothetical protein [Candidatus Polarisedimenticolaceae bacterium]
MIDQNLDDEEQMPLWDVALAALVTEKCQNKKKPLHIADFQQLSTKYAIRFDDIMDTVLRMVMHNKWVYTEPDGRVRHITEDEFNDMHKGGRLVNSDLKELDGSWRPVDQ